MLTLDECLPLFFPARYTGSRWITSPPYCTVTAFPVYFSCNDTVQGGMATEGADDAENATELGSSSKSGLLTDLMWLVGPSNPCRESAFICFGHVYLSSPRIPLRGRPNLRRASAAKVCSML